ncbi:neprilysin-1-like [Ylistrum balloti]|uniref:neprilysin-1-like n=1 Tax=Ylistrum balloti TaxID=509963 RepID=UPI0029059435|nr:neprilysin-1-like [Ylistrum balloti]
MSRSVSKERLSNSQNSLSITDVDVSMKDPKHSSTASRGILLGLVLCLVVILALVIALAVISAKKIDDADDAVQEKQLGQGNQQSGKVYRCLTADCARAAAEMANSIDVTADPCENFHQFACGRWAKRHVLKPDESVFGTFYQVREDVKVTLKYLLEAKVTIEDPESIKKAKHTYQSCVDEETIDSQGITDGIKFINELGGWPVLENSAGGQPRSLGLEELLKRTRKYSNRPVLDMYVYDDSKDIEHNIMYIDQPSLGMPDRKYFLNGRDDKMLKAYEKYAVELAKAFGADPTVAEQQMKEMVDFEIKIANLTMPSDQRRNADKLYNKMTVATLKQRYPQFQWMTYFNGVLGDEKIGYSVTESENVIVENPDYLSKIFTMINGTPNKERVLANYVVWISLTRMTLSLPANIRALRQDYYGVLKGSKTSEPRWHACTGVANDVFGLAVGKLFVKEAFDQEAKQDALQMISNLRSAMKGLLSENDWMDDATKVVAIDKLKAIEPRIGYPDDVMDDSFLDKRYENHTVIVNAYFNNTLNSRMNGAYYSLRKLRKNVDRQIWDTDPATVNAFYNPPRNQITFPAGILQPPFYHKDYPQYLNYGGIGYVIGHEITHGFDDNGRRYDKTGKLNAWWTNASIAQFKTKADCMVEQYSGYRVEAANTNLNGRLTLGENIADNGGLKESFRAYRKWVKENGEEPKLPGLEYTPNQLFFLNAAHVWCGIIRPEEALRRIRVDVHSDVKSRANGPTSNNEDFAKAFNCPVGSPQNPVKKCVIW